MAEKRKPEYTLLLRYGGKKKSHKIEVFKQSLWTGPVYGFRGSRFRIRVSGKWFSAGSTKYFTKTEIKNMFFRSIT